MRFNNNNDNLSSPYPLTRTHNVTERARKNAIFILNVEFGFKCSYQYSRLPMSLQFLPLRFSFHKNLCLNASQQAYEHWIRVGSCWHLNRDKKKEKENEEKTFLFHSVIVMLLVFHMLRSAWCICCVCIVLDAFLFHSIRFENWVWFNLIKGDGQVDLLLLHLPFRFVPFWLPPSRYRYLVNFSSYSFSGPDMLRKYHTQYPFTITHMHTNQTYTHSHSSQDIYYSEKK